MIKCTDHHITSNFGDYQSFRTTPHSGTDYGHQGMTYFPFVAPDDGTILSTNGFDSFILDCPQEYEMEDGTKARFQHQFVHINTPNLPKVGTFYKQGQVITKSGDSNGKAQPHLHWTCIVRWLRNGGGNNALCDPHKFVETGQVLTSKNENGMVSWYRTSSWSGIPKGSPIALKLLFRLKVNMDTVVYGNETWTREDIARIVSNLQGTPGTYDWEFEKFRKNPAQALIDILTWRDYKNKTAEQLVAARAELNTVKGLLNERDAQIASLNTSISNANTQLAICTQEKQELLIRADKLDAEFSDFKATSAIDKENLEKDIAQEKSANQVLTENNARLQEELRVCKESTGSGVAVDPVLTVLARLATWVKKILSKKI